MNVNITQQQMRKIYVLANELGFDNEDLHDIVQSITRKKHISKLTFTEAGKVIERLQGKPDKKRVCLSSSQEKYIKDLAFKLGWSDNPKRLEGFIKKYSKARAVKNLTPIQASKIIEGLKRLLNEKEMKKNASL